MEKESFEDLEVAQLLNAHFIAIKVDREERPDIDAVYMDVCQKITGSGGWPLSVFMTPEQKPFFAGTYFPKESMYGRIGFVELLSKIHTLWAEKRETLILKSDELMDHIKGITHSHTLAINEQVVDQAYEQLRDDYDKKYGGFSNAPKFPTPQNLLFLFNYYKLSGHEDVLKMCKGTLDGMYKGGLYDHIGGGFARYSTDQKWLVPHFEKMLYDNALLMMAYAMGFQITRNAIYKGVVEDTLQYLVRDLRDGAGGFYSAEDADSEGVEGKFYVFSEEEIIDVLGKDGRKFNSLYGVTKEGNFEGKNILNLIETPLENVTVEHEWLLSCKKKLLSYRDQRIRPHLDDKILTAWNGLLIGALAYAGRYMGLDDLGDRIETKGNPYLEYAIGAADFIKKYLAREDGGLYVRYRDGHVKQEGFLDDYAFLIWGLIQLYESTFQVDYLQWAISLNQHLIDEFWDNDGGGFFLYGTSSETLITRPKDIYDGAIPSGNSVAALNLLKLSRLTGDATLEEKARGIVKAFARQVNAYPRYHTFLMQTIMQLKGGSKDIVIAGSLDEPDVGRLVHELYQSEKWLTILINDGSEEMFHINKELKEKGKLQNKVTIYSCEKQACRAPITDIDEAIALFYQ